MLLLSGGFGSVIQALYVFSSHHPSVSAPRLSRPRTPAAAAAAAALMPAARLPALLDVVSDLSCVPASVSACSSGRFR